MTFGKEYINTLQVLESVGMTSIEPIDHNGEEIVPLQFLKSVLPKPETLGENYTGETSIGVRISGKKDGKIREYYVYNNTKHKKAYQETGMQAISYTTGAAAALGAKLMIDGTWNGRSGVFTVEEMNPHPFMEQLKSFGLPYVEKFDDEIKL
jgi:saccharopine dehydrogenase (NAD+, L-lysine-forming)